MQFGGVAPGHGEQQPAQPGLLQRVQPADRAEVDQGQLPVAQDQDVARVRVGVEGALQHHLAEYGAEQAAGQAVPVRAGPGQHRVGVADADAVQVLHDQHPAGGPLPVHDRDPDPRRAGDRQHVADLDAEEHPAASTRCNRAKAGAPQHQRQDERWCAEPAAAGRAGGHREI